ncbi:signal peptidase I [Geodermatophilus sp. SYSU D00815]
MRKVVVLGLTTVLLLAVGWLLWPATLGGGTSYLLTHGASMEPRFRTGDLAVLRATGDYAVGDVVAYRSPSLGTTVMHRIVDRDGAGFVTQGDNNGWLDTDRPTADDVLGELWLRVPGVGAALDAMTSPWVLALAALSAVGVLWPTRRPRGGHRAPGRAARRPRPAARAPRPRSAPLLPPGARGRLAQAALGGGTVAAVAAVGAAVLFALPSTTTEAQSLSVTQRGTFDYAGTAARGTTYPDGAVATGDPVYVRLAGPLTVSFAHAVTGGGLDSTTGTVRLDVVVTASDGWSAPLARGAAVDLRDGAGTATVVLDLPAASALLDRHADEVGASGTGATLTVTPVVEATAVLAGADVPLASLPPLSFALDATALRVQGDAGALAPSTEASATVERVAPRTFDVLGVVVPLRTARTAALLLVAVAAGVAAAATWLGRSSGPADALADRLVPVADLVPAGTVVDVPDLAAVRRLAERFDAVVLHHAGPHGETFAVQDGATTYRCTLPVAAPPEPAPRALLQIA